MTWQLAAYALVAFVLVGGFAWYEVSRPPARTVALVAALAALAVAGRLVFAPIPNVVATTDIVLITGYAVGPAPGFAVGALAAVVSNLWLGQGPWTPWQMAGWGLVGLGGAGLAVVTRRNLGRGGLAVACGLAGLAYGALLDLSVMVTYGGEQSLDRYLAISSRGVPFNVAHAAGNVALALAAGPALVRMISRYRSRFEFEWREDAPRRVRRARAASLSLPLALTLALVLSPLGAQGHGSASAKGWLERAQNADGGFGVDAGASSSAAMTGWAVLGLEAAGHNPLDVRRHGSSPIGYLRARAASLRSTGDLERTILALEGAGVGAHGFGGRDLAAALRKRRSRSGSFEGQVNLTAFGVLALRAAGTSPASLGRSTSWLRNAQNGDGGWGFQPRAHSDADSTGAALQALAAAGGRNAATERGATYLRRVQQRDGGFPLAGSGGSNTQSTAWAVQGLIAAGANPAAVRTRGHNPFDYLVRRQARDGHYGYSASSDQTPVWVTGQALLAVNRKAFPLAPVPRSAGGGKPPIAANPGADAGGDGGYQADGLAGSVGASGGGKRGDRSQGDGSRPKGGAGTGTRLASGQPASAPVGPAEGPEGDDGGPGPAVYVGAGFGALAAALAGGFFWYRRRLP